MVTSHKSIFTALVITLINQCLSKTTCNSDCMFYNSNKPTIDFDEFKHCSANYSFTSTSTRFNSKFMRILNRAYCHSSKCGYSKHLPYTVNGTCCKYLLVDIALKYSYRFNHKEIV